MMVMVMLDRGEFVQGVECCGDLSGGRRVCGVGGGLGTWWGLIVVSELLSPSLLQCLFGDRAGVGAGEVA